MSNDANVCRRASRCGPCSSRMGSLICKQGYVGSKILFFCMLANQPQGGIVFDSDPYDEWIETINKLGTSLFFAGACGYRVEGLHSASTHGSTNAHQAQTHSASSRQSRSTWRSRPRLRPRLTAMRATAPACRIARPFRLQQDSMRATRLACLRRRGHDWRRIVRSRP